MKGKIVNSENGTSQGFILPDDSVTLEFEEGSSFKGATVRVDTSIPIRTYIEVTRLSQSDEKGDMMAFFQIFGDDILSDWNVKGKKAPHDPIPADGAGFQEIDIKFALEIFRQWNKAVSEPTDPLAPDSGNSSQSEREQVEATAAP